MSEDFPRQQAEMKGQQVEKERFFAERYKDHFVAIQPDTRTVSVFIGAFIKDGPASRLPMPFSCRLEAAVYLEAIHGPTWCEWHEIIRYGDAQAEWSQMA